MDKSTQSQAADSLIEVPDLPRPEGAGSLGYGESFHLDTATGTARLELPLGLPKARALTPALTLRYDSGGSNGLFGFGFSLDLPSISRRTTVGLPQYDLRDQFVTETGAVLVPRYREEGGSWVLDRRVVEEGGHAHVVVAYRLRIEHDFDRIEHWTDQTDGTSFWRVTGKENVTLVYGRTVQARVSDPQHPDRIFRWMAEEQTSQKGDRVLFQYTRDDDRAVASLYPAAVRYGNFGEPGDAEGFAFTLRFQYPEDPRPDVYRSFRPGFELRTTRICTGLSVAHHFPESLGDEPLTVLEIRMEYEESGGVSLMKRVARVGRRRSPDGTIQERGLPPLCFSYSPWTPDQAAFSPLDTGAATSPNLSENSPLKLVDLYGDGLPGILSSSPDGGSPLYYRPLGNGRFGAPMPLPVAPVTPLDAPGRTALLDLSGEGKRDSVVLEPGQPGFYENQNDGRWGPFRSFDSAPTDLGAPTATFVDLSGSGRPDHLNAGVDEWRVSESRGRAGFGPTTPRHTPLGIGRYTSDWEGELVGFADVYGDGLSHLVTLSSGHLRVWPSLGYGQFGAPRDIPGLPVFEPTVTRRDLLFANLTGAGAADLLIMMGTRVAIYLNHYGQRMSFVREVTLPADHGALDLAQIVNLLGLGTSQLVIGFARGRGAYLDPSCGRRPFLLTEIRNGMGATTKIAYRSSVDYSLADRAAGTPWLTSLPFPVSVVAQVEEIDDISRTRLVRTAQYADGYFDPVDRQFAGFGRVEVQDSLTVDSETWHFPAVGREEYRALMAGDGVSPSVEPLFSRSWQQVGSFEQADALRAQMLKGAFRGTGDTLFLPGPTFSPAFETAGTEALRLAYKALGGRALLGESYGVDPDGSVKPVPYSVSQACYGVELLQPCLDGHPAVVLVVDLETAVTSYEQEAGDPAVQHSLAVAVDRFGQPIRTAEIGYARPAAPGRARLPGQTEAMMRLRTRGLINHTDGAYRNANGGTTPVHDGQTGGEMHVVGLPFEEQDFEVAGFAEPAPYFTRAQVRDIVGAALGDVVPYGAPFSPEKIQARLFGWQRSYYWDADRTGTVLQRTGPQLLAHHEQQAAFSDAFVAEVFGERVDGEYLRESGGYRYEDGYFWSDGQTVSYEGASLFYLPAAYTDPFGARTEVAFDKYQLLLTRKTDATGFSVRADYDYQALQPSRVVNENDDVEEYLYDPLGEVMVQAQYGTEGDRVAGDEPISKYVPVPASSAEEVLNDPQKYLQGAGAYYYYALDAWEQSPPMPVFTLEVRRRTWARPAEGGATDPDDVEIRLRYFDAALRRLAVAVLVSGVPPFSLRGPTTPALAAAVAAAEGDPPTQWLMTDQERFDNRGNAVVRYQPYFVPVPAYVAQPEAGRWTVAYDALYREIQTETPRGFLTATEHRAWSTTFWDEDDTVTRSPYYEQHFHDPDLPPAEKQALEMAVRLADTPTTTERDVLGRDIRVTALRVAGTDGPPAPPVPLHTTTWYDALDKPSAVADPRFYDPEDPARPRFYNSFVRYDMRGRPAWQKGADAGNVPLRGPVDGLPWIRLYDSMDNALDEWDRRGFRSTTEYDVLRLPTGSVLRGDGFDALVERIVYGTDPDLNNVHRIVEHDDQAGVERILLYSILGDAISSSRQMRVDAEGVADWRDPEKVPLQPTVWSWIVQGNALGEPVHYQAPNGATIATGRTRNGWPCLVALGGGATKVVAEARGFAPTGRPTETTLGNGLTVERTYDPDTLRLRRIRAVDGTGTPRQDLAYTYDPIGNVTNLENRVPAGGGDEPVNSVYRYDSLYRAILATGRRQTAGPGSTIEPYSQEYRYDDSGNLTEVLDAAGPAWSRRYVVSPSANHAITEGMAAGGPPDTFFDADGLMTALPDGAALYHNPAGRLSRVESESLGKSLFQYASNGVRLRKKTERGETYYLAPFIAEGTPADPAELAISLDDQMVAVARYPAGGGLPAPALLYQLDDRLQSVVERTDAEGARVDVQEFHPYGATSIYIASAGVPQDDRRYQFTGQERDPSTGLYAFPKRHYSPELARWIAPDPAGTVDGLNLFAYVRDNPLTLTDPTGQNGKDEKVPGSSPLNSIKTTFKTVNKWGVYSNALSEVLTASLHTPPYLTLLKGNSGPFLAAWQLKIGNIGAFGALFGGVSGMGYNLIDIHKKGFNFYNTTSLLGQIAFSFEGYNLYKSLLLQDKKAFHHAHTRIGFIGFAADALKVPSYIKSREYNQAIFYSGLSLGNLRTALPQETVESFFGGVARGLAAAYQRIGPSSRYPLSQQIVSSVPKTLAGVSGPQIIAATLFYQVVYKMFFSRKDDH